jgi:hypothetical protein
VVARKHRQKDRWLVTAWAADGDARPATVEIPDIGPQTFQARPAGSVYTATRDASGQITTVLIDNDPMLPSLSAARQ